MYCRMIRMATKPKSLPKSAPTKPSSTHADGSTAEEIAYKLLPKTKVLSEIDPVGNTISVCPTGDGNMWTSYDSSGLVTLRDGKGGILKEVEYSDSIRDISISPITHCVWACCLKDKCVMEIVSGKFVVKFHTDDDPWCLCVTHDNHILVGMAKKLIKFTTDGKIAMSSMKPRMGQRKTLLCLPYKVAECTASHNIAIVEQDQPFDGGKDEPHVLVMNKDMQEVYRFRGTVPRSYAQNAVKKIEASAFFPFDVAFDTVGNLVVSDYNNSCLYLLSDRGDFLRLIYSSKNVVRAVSVDYDNVLWAVFGSFGSQKVKLLKYSTT